MSDLRLPTMDPNIIVEHLVENTDGTKEATYRRLATGERWLLGGACNNCGLCYIGSDRESEIVGPPGTPDAMQDALAGDRWYETMIPGFIEDMQQMADPGTTPTATVTGCAFTITNIDPVAPE